MTITELIAALEKIRAEHGDLPVVVFSDVSHLTPDPFIRKILTLDERVLPEPIRAVVL